MLLIDDVEDVRGIARFGIVGVVVGLAVIGGLTTGGGCGDIVIVGMSSS